MKTINIQSRLTLIEFLINIVIFGPISLFLWIFLGRFHDLYVSCLAIIPIIPIVCAFISFLDDSLYLSEITFTDDEFRLRYKKGQETTEIKRILKEDIESFKLYIDANIDYSTRYCVPKLSVNIQINLKNGEQIIIYDKLFSDVYGKNPRMLFAQELMLNKDDIPNFKYECTGNNSEVIQNLENYYNYGKPLSYLKRVKTRFVQFPLFYKICIPLGLIAIIGCFILGTLTLFLK